MAQKELDIPVDGMHCSSCSLLVEKSLGKLDEVDSINVDLNTNKAHMVLNDKISPDIIDQTVESVGFTVPKEEVVIQIDGMHCASCVNNVEKFLPRVDGVVEANANLSNQKVTIRYYRDMLNLKEIQKTIEMLGFEYIGLDGELDVNDYKGLSERIKKEMSNLDNRIQILKTPNKTNLEPKLEYTMSLINNIDKYIRDAPVALKIKLLGSMFYEKIEYDGKNYRTKNYNQVLDLIYQQTSELRGEQKEKGESFSTLSNSVRIKGLEPPRLSASDPKSDVATNYTISATLGFCPAKSQGFSQKQCKGNEISHYIPIGREKF